MTKARTLILILLLLLHLPAIAIAAPAERVIKVCADPDPPPWTYWVRDASGKKTDQFTGASVDLVRTIFNRLGVQVDFIGNVPWVRCLKLVETGEFDFAMDAYADAERAKRFAYSAHYNTLTPQVFFRRDKPLDIRSIADLKRYQGCGMIGASYAHYGLTPDDLDLGVTTYEAMIRKLKAGRCDYFVEELEVISGYKYLAQDYLRDPALAHASVADANPPAKHLIAAIGSPASKLLPKFNKELAAFIKSGAAAEIWQRHAPDLPYRP
ncbi:substrate-binding periplasmic protein [Niveibacterium microcysteis]|uniref:Transporter substrate-binding domain-containing protein n=1 Tax=Niveibacterium microcysteis TaxID=2811415 RepID=A0ABX7MA81_9RHOO|nr:transporter substrate-binding domain-containing protein [Niveibacterium microcysteis]QSI78623.1 transporter substrate-binding domain-containing protein [Niveibacterium microcysteis]